MDLRLLADPNGGAVLTDVGRCQWVYDAPLKYQDAQGFLITVPAIGAAGLSDAEVYALWKAGKVTSTDLASIPRPCWDLLPPDGPWAKAAGIHDFLYKTRGTGQLAGVCWIAKPGGYSRDEADLVLDDAMASIGVPEDKRLVIYEAVRVGGGVGWGR